LPKTREKTGLADLVPPPVPPSLPIGTDAGLIELAELWAGLDAEGRADLLAVARGLGAGAVDPAG